MRIARPQISISGPTRELIAAFGQPGDNIPGSDLYRSYCAECSEPIRVRSYSAAVACSETCQTCRHALRTERGRMRH